MRSLSDGYFRVETSFDLAHRLAPCSIITVHSVTIQQRQIWQNGEEPLHSVRYRKKEQTVWTVSCRHIVQGHHASPEDGAIQRACKHPSMTGKAQSLMMLDGPRHPYSSLFPEVRIPEAIVLSVLLCGFGRRNREGRGWSSSRNG